MRILGLDYGEKRIGLAITDRQNIMAIPFGMIENNNSISENILKLIKENDIGRIVIGRPINLNGQPGYQTEIVDRFISNVLKTYKLPISIIDERFTSKISSGIISGGHNARKDDRNINQNKKMTKKKMDQARKSGAADTISAALILEDYLKSQENI
jgi:putative holliday junction resolvase